MTVRQNLGDLLSEVQYRKGKVIITKAGKPVAALVDIALFERIRSWMRSSTRCGKNSPGLRQRARKAG